MRKIGIFLVVLLFPITSISAYCQYNDLARYKNLASNISTSYEYVMEDNKVTFAITLNNLNKDLYIVDTTNNKTYWYNDEELVITNYAPGTAVKYKVYTTDSSCSENLLYTIRVNLPSYNVYYNDPICRGIEDYILCQKWYANNIDYNTFVSKVTTYKKGLSGFEKPVIVVPEKTFFEKIIDLLLKYYYIVFTSIALICGLLIYFINKRNSIYS